eukprot:jgi/Chlat1/2221/Chrsp17S02553
MAAEEAGKGRTEQENVEVVPSGHAYSLAQAWLDAADKAAGRTPDETVEPVEVEPRPARLGLGAKYLPHARVAASLGSVEKRLLSKVAHKGRKLGLNEASRNGGGGASTSSHQPARDNDDDEEESRAGMFVKKQKVQGNARDQMLQLRHASLESKRQKRRNKHKPSAQPGVIT